MPEIDMPPISQLRGRPLGRILIKMGKVTRAQVSEALDLQKKKRGPLGQLLIDADIVDDPGAGCPGTVVHPELVVELVAMEDDQVVVEWHPVVIGTQYAIAPRLKHISACRSYTSNQNRD